MIVFFKLSDILRRRGLSQKHLSDKTGLATSTVSQLVRSQGQRVFTSTVIDKICSALSCQPGDIMEFKSGDKVT